MLIRFTIWTSLLLLLSCKPSSEGSSVSSFGSSILNCSDVRLSAYGPGSVGGSGTCFDSRTNKCYPYYPGDVLYDSPQTCPGSSGASTPSYSAPSYSAPISYPSASPSSFPSSGSYASPSTTFSNPTSYDPRDVYGITPSTSTGSTTSSTGSRAPFSGALGGLLGALRPSAGGISTTIPGFPATPGNSNPATSSYPTTTTTAGDPLPGSYGTPSGTSTGVNVTTSNLNPVANNPSTINNNPGGVVSVPVFDPQTNTWR